MSVLEVALFNVNEGVEQDVFLKHAAIAEMKIREFDGFIKRQLLCDDNGQWVDLVWWESADAAHHAAEAVMQDEVCFPFFSAINESSLDMGHYETALVAGETASNAGVIVETVIFKPRDGVTDEAIDKAVKVLHTFVEQQPGYISRQLVKRQDNRYIDIVWWTNFDDAMKAGSFIMQDANVAKHANIFDESQMQMLHLKPMTLELV